VKCVEVPTPKQELSRMADSPLVLNDLLCFLVNKFVTVGVKLLKPALYDFYDADLLSAAKFQLMNDIDDMNLPVKRQHIPQRRDGDARLMREVDDVVSLMIFLDEQKAIDNLPRYVASSPDNMPSLRLYEGDVNVIMTKLRGFDSKVDQLESVLAAICTDVRNIQVGLQSRERHPISGTEKGKSRVVNKPNQDVQLQPAVAGGSRHTLGNSIETDTTSATDETTIGPLLSKTATWAAVSSTPCNNRFAVLSTDDGELNEDDDNNQQPYTVAGRRRRNVKRSRRDSPDQPTSRAAPAATAAQQQRRQQPVVGKATTVSPSIKLTAAKKLYKKSVFCVDNVSVNCSEQDIISFVADKLSVEVLSCFPAKSRRQRNDSDDLEISDRKAFRLCINDDDRSKLLNSSLWPRYIKLSEWYFKSRQQASEDKRRRMDTAHSVTDNNSAAAAVAVTTVANSTLITNDDTIMITNESTTSLQDGDEQ